jgi:hypothetical protein
LGCTDGMKIFQSMVGALENSGQGVVARAQ